MHPSFGVPWPRLQRAAARLTELAGATECSRVQAQLVLCGLKYLLTYRLETGRRLTHYIDDGLREAVQQALPALMKGCRPTVRRASRLVRPENAEFEQLVFAFRQLQLPPGLAEWMPRDARDPRVVRLSFGLGVVSRFAPESHQFVRRMLEKPLSLRAGVLDVLESFRWHPEWSVALRR